MAIGTLAAFWAVSFLLVLVPGADWAYAIAAGLRDRSVLPAVAGLLAGYAGLTAVVAAGVAAVIAKGAGVSGLNPKALLLFLAFLPQFLTHGAAWPFAAQIALLGMVHTANCAVVYTSVGATAGRVLRARPAAATAVTRCSGAILPPQFAGQSAFTGHHAAVRSARLPPPSAVNESRGTVSPTRVATLSTAFEVTCPFTPGGGTAPRSGQQPERSSPRR
jgi:threonine/homoserine/homoserine lactone efflux protein